MMHEKLAKAINEQINKELYSAYLYLSMASWLDTSRLKGAGSWMRKQVKEELLHVAKFYGYLNDRETRVALDTIGAPPVEWASLKQVFEDSLKHERSISSSINQLMGLCAELKDHASHAFLEWFVNEQVEEEAAICSVLDQISLLGDAPGGLYLIDKDLAQRPELGLTSPPVN